MHRSCTKKPEKLRREGERGSGAPGEAERNAQGPRRSWWRRLVEGVNRRSRAVVSGLVFGLTIFLATVIGNIAFGIQEFFGVGPALASGTIAGVLFGLITYRIGR